MRFERISKYPDAQLPVRATKKSAGYDFFVAEDVYYLADNEGHIMFQVYNINNLSPVTLHKGDRIGQGVFVPYAVIDDDNTTAERTGGFGST